MGYAQTKPVQENKMHTILRFWDTNESPNPCQKTRPSGNLKKENMTSSRLWRSDRPQNENERKRTDKQILKSGKKTKNAEEH